MTGPVCFQSKPTLAARFWIFSARNSAGRARATPSRAPAGSAPASLAARSAALRASQDTVWASAVATLASPNTCGWRSTILSAMAAATSAKPKAPASRAIWAW